MVCTGSIDIQRSVDSRGTRFTDCIKFTEKVCTLLSCQRFGWSRMLVRRPACTSLCCPPHCTNSGIGYASTFIGFLGFYLSVAFYAMSFLINAICSSKLAYPSPSSAVSHTQTTSVFILCRVVSLSRQLGNTPLRVPLFRTTWWKVVEATLQSTAIYAAAAISLIVTFLDSTGSAYPTCLNVFPALIVRATDHDVAMKIFTQELGRHRGSCSRSSSFALRSTSRGKAPALALARRG